MSSQAGPFGQPFGSFGQSMPPYSTDPELSRQRHAESDYTNSSDAGFYTSTTDETMVDALMPSSPPPESPTKSENGGNIYDKDDDDDDEPTDEDEDDENDMVQSGLARIGARSESTLRPVSTLGARRESSLHATPEMLVTAVFDDEKTSEIPLNSRGLTHIPAAFEDLANHEDLGSKKFKIDLTDNNIVKVYKALYSIRRLEYLSLRANSIIGLSPLIEQLTNLKELQLCHNNLKTLPVELLKLPNLQTLTTFPNSFIEPPDDSTRSMMIIRSPVPSLVELAQRKIAQAGTGLPYAEFERTIGQVISQFQPLEKFLRPVLDTVYMGRICSICGSPYIRPAALHLEWKCVKIDHSNQLIPFRTTFCTHACMAKFQQQV